jgi:hypothetical protein
MNISDLKARLSRLAALGDPRINNELRDIHAFCLEAAHGLEADPVKAVAYLEHWVDRLENPYERGLISIGEAVSDALDTMAERVRLMRGIDLKREG